MSSSRNIKRTYRVQREWSIEVADYTYAVYTTTHWEDNETSVKRILSPYPPGDESKQWAEKNAEHLGVKIADEEP